MLFLLLLLRLSYEDHTAIRILLAVSGPLPLLSENRVVLAESISWFQLHIQLPTILCHDKP